MKKRSDGIVSNCQLMDEIVGAEKRSDGTVEVKLVCDRSIVIGVNII